MAMQCRWAAKLKFLYPCGMLGISYMETRIIVVHAPDSETAYDKCVEIGKESEFSEKYDDGHIAMCEFLGVVDMIDLDAPEYEPCDVWCDIDEIPFKRTTDYSKIPSKEKILKQIKRGSSKSSITQKEPDKYGSSS